MKVRSILGIACAIAIIYEVGKAAGKVNATRAFAGKYGKNIPDDEITIDLTKGWIVFHMKNKK